MEMIRLPNPAPKACGGALSFSLNKIIFKTDASNKYIQD
jgi:hypothetical protein